MRKTVQQTVFDTLWRGQNPYSNFPYRKYRLDEQGWNSHHSFLADTIVRQAPNVVVEVGVWKGGSTIHMAKTIRDQNVDGVVVAVDTWLGSWEHWEQDERFADLLFEFGYPCLYNTFLANVVNNELSNYIVPLPLDSANAAFVLQRKSIRPQMLHIDGGHDYEAVMADLKRWWPLLEPGGTVVADDYDADGRVWPSVRDAVNDFLKDTSHVDFEALPYKCRFSKPRS